MASQATLSKTGSVLSPSLPILQIVIGRYQRANHYQSAGCLSASIGREQRQGVECGRSMYSPGGNHGEINPRLHRQWRASESPHVASMLTTSASKTSTLPDDNAGPIEQNHMVSLSNDGVRQHLVWVEAQCSTGRRRLQEGGRRREHVATRRSDATVLWIRWKYAMLVSREKLSCPGSGKKLVYVVRRTERSASVAMMVNRVAVFLVFTSGVVVAVIGTLLSQYIRDSLHQKTLPDNNYRHIFIPLPSESTLNVYDEASLDVALPSSDLSRRLDNENSAATVAEALTSLHLALEMKLSGKQKKAIKLFQHAVALAPRHPDILNRYGEFLEYTQNDVIKANEYYVRALSYQPNHEGALMNSQRTARVVEELDRRMLRRIDEKRNALSAIPDNNAALIRAKKEAYFQHIYHTVGIEGNTMSLAQTRAIVETRTAVAGKSIDEHNEILGLDAAMKYINGTLVNKVGSISIKDILEIHTRVLGHVDPVQGGQFRRTQVYVGGHVPPGPGDIHYLMEEFAMWLNSESAIRMHPVRYAALAHYKLVHIHPFSDGNGRTSRLLMNVILMQAGYPPVIIHKQHRHTYYENLQIANAGDVRPFVRFIAECTEQTLDLFLWATTEFSKQVPALGQDTLFTERRHDRIALEDIAGVQDSFEDD